MEEFSNKPGSNRHKKVLWIALLCLLIALSGIAYIVWHERWLQKAWDHRPKTEGITPGYYKITYVYDGDTFAVDMNSTPEKVRLIGISFSKSYLSTNLL